MKQRKHPVRGGIFGFLFGLFLGFDLVLLGVVPSNSPAVTVLAVVGLVGGVALGITTPLGRWLGRRAPVEPQLPVDRSVR